MWELQGGCGQERSRNHICLMRAQQKRREMAAQGAPEKELERGCLPLEGSSVPGSRLPGDPMRTP